MQVPIHLQLNSIWMYRPIFFCEKEMKIDYNYCYFYKQFFPIYINECNKKMKFLLCTNRHRVSLSTNESLEYAIFPPLVV